MNRYNIILTILSLIKFSFTSSFTIVAPTRISASASLSFVVPRGKDNRKSCSKLDAIIYGWDDGDDGHSSSIVTNNHAYTTVSSDTLQACSPSGMAVAEGLNVDQDRIGSLARLAVAFSPTERALSLKDIEQIEVICVRGNSIEIAALVCENGGCVSLSVPIRFPRECSEAEWLEGCVKVNLDELGAEAESKIIAIEQQQRNEINEHDIDDLWELNKKVDYPSWWVAPECNRDLITECDDIRILLNENEFQNDVIKLAQDALNHSNEGSLYTVKRARVSAVGPAGICLRVGAIYQQQEQGLTFLDVVYPFGGEPLQDAESLRAAVLGAIAVS